MNLLRPQASRSLKAVLIVLFLLFSLVPLAFVTWYSVSKYEKAIDRELSNRFESNGREVESIFAEMKQNLRQRRDQMLSDPNFIYHLSLSDVTTIRELSADWISDEYSPSLSFFNRSGRLLISLFKDQNGAVREFSNTAKGALVVSEENLRKAQGPDEYAFVEQGTNRKTGLILFSKVTNRSGKIVGYFEQRLNLDQGFFGKLKDKLKADLFVIRSSGHVTVGTRKEFYEIDKGFLESKIQNSDLGLFDLPLQKEQLAFQLRKMDWGQSKIYLAIGASKADSKATLQNVNYAFYTVMGAVFFLLVLTSFFTSNLILKPLHELLEGIQQMQSSDQPIEIRIQSSTEVGLLAASFNQMSRYVSKARADLKSKIKELEATNSELLETQSRLVHSSKMVSLGEVVAGVAHELNNPIGFIYSNMSLLRDYSDRLLKLLETAEKHPDQLATLKKELDLEYIRKDLPKLISSCEDGARRTRDIVLGLRNFSRLEETKLKEIDLHQAIDDTLGLLSGEIKNRIQVHRSYQARPQVLCYASQINQVFMNILSNACQAIPALGNLWISTRSFSKGSLDMVEISIQDSGAGIPPGIIDKIFDPFFSTKGIGQGTGLGLSISYGIIQSHGGEILVKSQEGIGTEFVVQLPVTQVAPKA